jgi:hypothetical protein
MSAEHRKGRGRGTADEPSVVERAVVPDEAPPQASPVVEAANTAAVS